MLKFREFLFLYRGFCIIAILGMAGGCSPQQYKADADKEVYNIIDSKWKNSFGQKANYRVSDTAPSPNDVNIAASVPSGAINLAQAAAMATTNNRDYQTRKETLYLSALDLTLTRHQYALQLFGTVDGGYVKKGAGDSREEDVSVSSESGGTFRQILADGTIVSTRLAVDWLRFLTGDPRTSLGSVLSASVTMPLLGSGAGKVEREKLTLAERGVLYQIRNFNRYRQTFVVSIVNDYYRVLQLRDEVANAENNYKIVAESKERLEMEAQAGRRNRFEVDQAEQNMLTAKDSYVSTQQEYEQALDSFKIRLSLPTDANVELDQNELRALENIGITQPDYTLDMAVETALLRRLDLANSADSIDDSLRSVILATDGLGTELNLLGSASVNSKEKTEFDNLQFHRGTYGIGFEADLPFDRKAERNAYRRALINLEQSRRQYENDVEEVKLSVRKAYRQLREAAQRHEIQVKSLNLARSRVESTSLLLEAGRLTTRDLLDSQNALLQAQNNVTAALVDHIIAKLSFFQDVGILQVKPDGMWQER
ncbi:MAG: TolC family protein [Planctomycetota bacterium]|nr:TolC family protein [Planctomycetota bacterium]